MLYLIATLFGAAIASFLGVVIERNGKIGGRSRCSSCRHQLSWRENIPLVSFLLLRGECAHCHSPIPYRLPLIELGGAAAGVWLAHWANQTITVINVITIMKFISAAAIAAALVWMFFSDLIYGVISDWAVGIGVVGALIWHISRMSPIWPIVAAATAAALFFWFLVFVTRGRGMGTGDITLAFFLGLWLGWPLIAVGIWLGFSLGALAGCLLIAVGRKRFGQTIPFGPFLIVGSLVAIQWGPMMLDKWF